MELARNDLFDKLLPSLKTRRLTKKGFPAANALAYLTSLSVSLMRLARDRKL